jgi:hypothetical protein
MFAIILRTKLIIGWIFDLKKKLRTLLCDFFSFLGPKRTHFHIRGHENKEKHLFYFGLRIPLPIQIQLLENKKK